MKQMQAKLHVAMPPSAPVNGMVLSDCINFSDNLIRDIYCANWQLYLSVHLSGCARLAAATCRPQQIHSKYRGLEHPSHSSCIGLVAISISSLVSLPD